MLNSSKLTPSAIALHSWIAGQTNLIRFGLDYEFNEFARLELWDGERNNGQFWFRISDYHKWHFRAKFIANPPLKLWIDDGHTTDNGHLGN